MEEPSDVVSTLHFRHFGPDNVYNGSRNCCSVVDICTNNDVALQHNECMQLLHLHWEDTDIKSEVSSITVSEANADQKSTVITPDRVNNLLKDQTALHDFIRKMLTAHQVQLIHMEYAPLVLTFQHCGGSDRNMLLREKFKVFIIVKEFVLKATGLQDLKGLHIGIHKSKSVSMETSLWCRYFHRVYRDVSAQRRWKSARSSSEDDATSIAMPPRIDRRFISIEDELFKQRQFMESQFIDQDQQYENIRASLMKISQAFTNDRRQPLEPLASEDNNELNPVRNLIEFDLDPLEDASSLHSAKGTAYRPEIEILSDDDDEEEGEEKEEEEEEEGEEKAEEEKQEGEEKEGEVMGKEKEEDHDGDDRKVGKDEEKLQARCSAAREIGDVSIGSKEEREHRKIESDQDLRDDVLPNASDAAGSNHTEDEHDELEYRQNRPTGERPVLQQKRQFTDFRSDTNVYNQNRDSLVRSTENNEFPETVGDMYAVRKQTYERSYSHKTSYQTTGNRSRSAHGHASIAQCRSVYREQQARRQPKSGVADASDEAMNYLEDLLYSYYYTPSQQNAYSDMQSDAVNIQPPYAPTPLTCEEPKKEKIEGNETKRQALRLMIECAIGISPHSSRIWESAEEALLEEKCPAPRHDLALDTVICLDTSGSMRGEAFQEMKKITLDFINGIEDIAEQHDVEENIALVIFGGRAKVIHHLSNDYGSLRDTLEKITPGGPSPIHEGLVVSMAALAKGGTYRVNNRMELRPRMIFLTDGKPTAELPETANDSHWLSIQEQTRIILAFREIRSRQPSDDLPDEIIFVPVGHSCDRNCLETLAAACDGKVKNAGSFAELSKFHYLRKVAVQAIEYASHKGNETDIFVAGLRSLFSNLGPGIDRASTMEIYKVIQAYLTSVWNDINEEPGLPPLGTRVVRGPDWEWGNQDTEGPGTIYNHAKQSIVSVIWDNGHSNYYRYGHDGKYDVTVVEDQPRVLSGNLVAVGVQVVRGPGWHRLYDNQDGGHGSYGTVIRVTEPGKVKVRWQNGEINDYRYGICGMVDIAIRDPIACILETTAKTNPHMDTYQDTAEAKSSKDGDRPYIWQREDKQNGWEPYSEANDAKLKKAYGKNPTGSCLVQRNKESFRVSFKSLQERSLADKSWVPVRKYFQ
ncbi:uncharacterized protein [Haliotis asinina]|uniref:uncharacterized protein n=1 Tax=Haliotis asinina TaxID=109174 RepID=UPI003531C260